MEKIKYRPKKEAKNLCTSFWRALYKAILNPDTDEKILRVLHTRAWIISSFMTIMRIYMAIVKKGPWFEDQ